jgi:hypothetical protein
MRAMLRPRIVARLAVALCLVSCATRDSPVRASLLGAPTASVRTFRMGFTAARGGPKGGGRNGWAPTVRFIRRHGDLITVHRDGPTVPWEALAQGRVSAFRNKMIRERARLGEGLPLYVLITPLNIFRNGLGGRYPDSLGPACVSNPNVRIAFKNYALVMVEAMNPDYLGLFSEVNIYANVVPKECPGDFEAVVSLYKEIYRELKALHPSLLIFPTFQLDFLRANNRQLMPARFAPELDRLALSLYPGGNLTRLRPSEIPDDYIRWARAATDAPLVIAETGYGSRAVAGVRGSPELQTEYVGWIFEQAARERAEFVTWFFSADPRYVEAPPGIGFINAFRFYGLATPRFRPKPALDLWRQYLALPYAPP